MTTDEMRAMKEWSMIKESIDKAVSAYQAIYPEDEVKLVDRKSSFVITVNGEDELEIDADIIQEIMEICDDRA